MLYCNSFGDRFPKWPLFILASETKSRSGYKIKDTDPQGFSHETGGSFFVRQIPEFFKKSDNINQGNFHFLHSETPPKLVVRQDDTNCEN